MRYLASSRLRRCAQLSLAAAGLAGSLASVSAQTKAAETPASTTAAAAPADDDVVHLQVFTVTGTKGQSYGASNMASATRMNTPIENVPQTISVMNAALLSDIGAYSLDQALRYTPGATQRQNSPDGAIIRGLASGFTHYEDGFSSPSLVADMANIDRIELIKGPSASVAGASESTGFLNYITKKPLFTEQRSLDATLGSWNFFRAIADATGPVPGYEQSLAYRIIGLYMNSDSYRDNEHTRKTAVYPSLTWKISPDTQLLVQVSAVNNFTPGGFGTAYLAPTFGATATPIVVPANAKIGLNRWMPINVNSSGIEGMGRDIDLYSVSAVLTHRFNDIFAVRQAAKFYDYKNDLYRNSLADNFTYDADGYLWGTYQVGRTISKSDAYRLQGDLAIRLADKNDRFTMRTLVGYELARSQGSSQTFASASSTLPFNILAPIFSNLPPSLNKTVDNKTKGGSIGLFANTQIGLFNDYAIITGGIRRDQNKAGWTLNNLNGATTSTPTTPWIQSPLIGLTIKPRSWLALFGVYSDAGAAATTVSTYPGIPTTDSRQVLVSVTPDTTNWEYGAKMTFFKGDFSVSLSHFDTLQSGITRNQTDPSYPGGSRNFIDSGNRSKGYELGFSGNVTRDLSIFGGYVYDETSAPGFKPDGSGLELRGTPKNKVQLFARYQFSRSASGAGFGIKAGVVTQGRVYGRASDTYTIPGATRYDVGIDYRSGKWNFATGIINITDVIFPTFAVGQGSNTIDDPRNFYFSAGMRF